MTLSQSIFAVETAATTLSTATAPKVEEKPKFQYTLLLDYSSNLYKRDEARFADSSTLLAVGKLNLQSGDAVSVLGEFTKEYQDEERFDIDSANLIYGRKALGFETFTLPMSARVILPVNEELRDRQGLRMGAAIDVTPVLTTDAIGWLGWSLSARTRLTKNFHEFTIATNGQSNIEYSLSERIDLGYAFNDVWSVSTTIIYSIARTYESNEKESFSWAQDISYAVNKLTTIGVGHTNEGGLLKPNGDSNVQAFDENSSKVYAFLKLAN
jgi:hypothetical protein